MPTANLSKEVLRFSQRGISADERSAGSQIKTKSKH